MRGALCALVFCIIIGSEGFQRAIGKPFGRAQRREIVGDRAPGRMGEQCSKGTPSLTLHAVKKIISIDQA